jgi:hypothetical protein
LRRQIIFMDRDDILNLYVVTNLLVPGEAPMFAAGGGYSDEPPF